jgi:site-specific DNA-methyltransferase (adenine-specific)
MFRYSLVWHKTSPTGHLNAKKMPLRGHEDILVFYRKLPTYNPQMTHGHPRKVASAKNRQAAAHRANAADGNYNLTKAETVGAYDSTSRYPTSVLRFPSDRQQSNLHPQQKPVALLETLIMTYTNPGETVLDNAAGSGSTGEAAENCGRSCILIENNGKHYDRADDRLPNFKKPVGFV